MKKITTLAFLTLFFFTLTTNANTRDKVFVVERESSTLAVLNHNLLTNKIKGMHNLNHAVVKFKDNEAYVITRDGYVIKFDPINEVKIKEYRVSKSTIGFTIGENFLAVANYDNQTVEILSRDLDHIQTIKTDSRNVGIKLYKDYLVFECMDSDEIWVMKNTQIKAKSPHFELHKKLLNVGKVPFDAMIKDNLYIAGFFNSPTIGVLNLDTLSFKEIALDLDKKNRVLKVPHFGLWSISDNYFFIPAVGAKNVLVFDHEFNLIKNIEVIGSPVFTSLSPDKRYLAVTFSGKNFPKVQIIDTQTFKVIKDLELEGMVLHVRWSSNGKYLYLSINDTNEVLAYNTAGWWKNFMFPVDKPSGIFIYKMESKPISVGGGELQPLQ
ncbi:MAG: nitrite reductase [Methyloprofundus sp.]|nr:nitrite reductase [Methyloprofundus sp.]